MEEKSGIKLWFFIIFVLTIAIGGFFLMRKYTNLANVNKTKNNNENQTSFKDIRIDNSKAYIYFTDDALISSEPDISFPIVIINFEDTNNIAEKLNNNTEKIKKSLKSNSDNEVTYAYYPDYSIYEFENYISLVCDYYIYTESEEAITYNKSTAYVFDKYTGELYTSSKLLSTFNLTNDKVREIIKKEISDIDLINGEETLDVDATLNGVSFDNLYVNKLGKLSIGVLVKSSEKDYNYDIVLS